MINSEKIFGDIFGLGTHTPGICTKERGVPLGPVVIRCRAWNWEALRVKSKPAAALETSFPHYILTSIAKEDIVSLAGFFLYHLILTIKSPRETRVPDG